MSSEDLCELKRDMKYLKERFDQLFELFFEERVPKGADHLVSGLRAASSGADKIAFLKAREKELRKKEKLNRKAKALTS